MCGRYLRVTFDGFGLSLGSVRMNPVQTCELAGSARRTDATPPSPRRKMYLYRGTESYFSPIVCSGLLLILDGHQRRGSPWRWQGAGRALHWEIRTVRRIPNTLHQGSCGWAPVMASARGCRNLLSVAANHGQFHYEENLWQRQGGSLVGADGYDPPTSRSQAERSTKLS